jgi:hypothetical protein
VEEGGEILQRTYTGSRSTLEESKIGRSAPGTQSPGSPFPVSSDDDETTYDQARLIRKSGKGRRPGTAPRQLATEHVNK